MKKRIKIALVVATIVAIPLMGDGMQQSKSEEKSLLVDFIEYCKTCENLRQVDPNKDYTQATLHELKNAARCSNCTFMELKLSRAQAIVYRYYVLIVPLWN